MSQDFLISMYQILRSILLGSNFEVNDRISGPGSKEKLFDRDSLRLKVLCVQEVILLNSNTLQYFARFCKTLQDFAVLCKTLQDFAVLCKTLQDFARLCKTLQDFAVLYKTLQSFSVLCSPLQSFAVLCKKNSPIAVIA